jgi:hypothetical protein
MPSNAELLLSVQLEQAGIPFEREFAFAKELGRKWRADFAIHESDGVEAWIGPHRGPAYAGIAPLLVEIDGGGFVAGRHTRGEGFEKDAEKASAAAILGYRVIRLTPRQVEDGRGLLWIKQALGLEAAA